jgi:hypothetical protein
MSRIAKADVNRALETAAKTILEAGGADGRVSRADIKGALNKLEGPEKKLADMFFRFIDHRDFKTGAQVTKKDIDRAVTYAKEHMVAKYDLNNNGLSAAEVKKMSLTGKLAVDLAKALKSAGTAGPVAGETFNDFVDRMKTESEVTLTDPSKVSGDLAKQIILALHESTHDDVKTIAQAFEAADQGEIVVRQLKDPKTGERFTSIDYGAGDNTYGAIFKSGSIKVTAGIHDGDLMIK